jgi:hypothetical protein
MNRSLCLSSLFASGLAFAAPKPAAVQVCVELPSGTPLFSSTAGPFTRAIAKDVFMLDLEARFDGVAPERITKVSASCFRAWVSPRKVGRLELSFERVPLNFATPAKAVAFSLKSDLWFDGGTFTVEQRPFAALIARVPGTVTVERETPQGLTPQAVTQLPQGAYRISFVPPPAPTHPCATELEVTAVGSVTEQRQPALLSELKAHYQLELLPEALKRMKMTCRDSEVAVVQARLIDGLFVRPFEPAVTRRTLPEREPRYLLRHQGQTLDLAQPAQVEVAPGDELEVTMELPSQRAALPEAAQSVARSNPPSR